MRFEVEDLDELAATLAQRGQQPGDKAVTLKLAPYGTFEVLNVTTPDGALIQFLEGL